MLINGHVLTGPLSKNSYVLFSIKFMMLGLSFMLCVYFGFRNFILPALISTVYYSKQPKHNIYDIDNIRTIAGHYGF